MGNKPDAIIVGDIHYRDTQPRCRLDDFWETQKRKALWLKDLWEEYERPLVLQPGDVFHHWKSSPQVIRAVLEYLPPMVCVPGNHDLPNHSMQLYGKSALAVVDKAGNWVVLTGPQERWAMNVIGAVHGHPWGITPANIKLRWPRFVDVLLAHITVLHGPAPFKGVQAGGLLEQMTGYSLIVTGDNHKPIWITTKNHRHLLNPGSFTRQSADEDHHPSVFLWWGASNTLEEVPVPIEDGVITREHLTTTEQRDERLEAFVRSLDSGVEVTVKFRDNLMLRLEGSGVRPMVKQLIMEALDG